MQVFHAAGAPIEWDEQYVAKEVDPRTNSFVTRENLDSVLVCRPPLPCAISSSRGTSICTCISVDRAPDLDVLYSCAQKHKIGLKAPMTTPIGKGFRSLNLTLRKVRFAPDCLSSGCC